LRTRIDRQPLLQFASPAFGRNAFGGSFFTVALRMNAEVVPIRFRKYDRFAP